MTDVDRTDVNQTEPTLEVTYPPEILEETRVLADELNRHCRGHSASAVAMAAASVFISAAKNSGMNPTAAHELIDFLLEQIPKGKQ